MTPPNPGTPAGAAPAGRSRTATRVTVVSISFPLPADIGRRVVMSGIMRHLCAEYGAENVRYILIGNEDPAALPTVDFQVEVVPLGSTLRRLPGIALDTLVLRRRSIQERLLLDRRARARVRALLAEPGTELVVADTLRVMDYLPPPADRPWRTVLYLDDLYSVRYRRLLETMAAHPEAPVDAVGTFSRFLPERLRWLAGANGLQKPLLSLEASLLERRERASVHLADLVLLINRREAAWLAAETGSGKVHGMPPLLPPRGGTAPERRPAARPDFVFLGNFSYPANGYALGLFLREAMAGALRAVPEATLTVIGRGAGPELRAAAAPFGDRVRFADFVPDLGGVFAEATAMVAPLPYGSGLKLKVVDALAAGLPVIGTDCAFEGFDLTHGRDCLVARRIGDFPALMRQAADPAKNAALSRAAHAAWTAQFGEAAVTALYRDFFGTGRPADATTTRTSAA